jgi:hypothetical protein
MIQNENPTLISKPHNLDMFLSKKKIEACIVSASLTNNEAI